MALPWDHVPENVYDNLYDAGSDFESLLHGLKLSSPSGPPEEEDAVLWYACVLWSSSVQKEFEKHVKGNHALYTTKDLGKVLVTAAGGEDREEDEGNEEIERWPGFDVMDLKKPYKLVNVITDKMNVCGADQFLRVEEMLGAETEGDDRKVKRMWDLMVDPEFMPLVEEMTRRFKEGVKTTVMIWGYYEDKYKVSWQDGKELVVGESALRICRTKEGTKALLIFHQEAMSENRKRRINRCAVGSELYERFQDKQLGCAWTCETERVNGKITCFIFLVASQPPKEKKNRESKLKGKEGDEKEDCGLLSSPKNVAKTKAFEFDELDLDELYNNSDSLERNKRELRAAAGKRYAVARKAKGLKQAALAQLRKRNGTKASASAVPQKKEASGQSTSTNSTNTKAPPRNSSEISSAITTPEKVSPVASSSTKPPAKKSSPNASLSIKMPSIVIATRGSLSVETSAENSSSVAVANSSTKISGEIFLAGASPSRKSATEISSPGASTSTQTPAEKSSPEGSSSLKSPTRKSSPLASSCIRASDEKISPRASLFTETPTENGSPRAISSTTAQTGEILTCTDSTERAAGKSSPAPSSSTITQAGESSSSTNSCTKTATENISPGPSSPTTPPTEKSSPRAISSTVTPGEKSSPGTSSSSTTPKGKSSPGASSSTEMPTETNVFGACSSYKHGFQSFSKPSSPLTIESPQPSTIFFSPAKTPEFCNYRLTHNQSPTECSPPSSEDDGMPTPPSSSFLPLLNALSANNKASSEPEENSEEEQEHQLETTPEEADLKPKVNLDDIDYDNLSLSEIFELVDY